MRLLDVCIGAQLAELVRERGDLCLELGDDLGENTKNELFLLVDQTSEPVLEPRGFPLSERMRRGGPHSFGGALASDSLHAIFGRPRDWRHIAVGERGLGVGDCLAAGGQDCGAFLVCVPRHGSHHAQPLTAAMLPGSAAQAQRARTRSSVKYSW